MVNLGLLSGKKPLKSVKVCFRIPYYTQWGQHLIVCGSEAMLGSWNVKKGLLLKPSHQGDELIWSGSVPVPLGFKSEYTYYVVDDERNIVRWEGGNRRKLVLPEGLEEGLSVELRDLWQTGSDGIPFRSAFKDVIFRKSGSLDIERPHVPIQTKLGQEDSIIIQFKICCPNVNEGTSIYVIGSSLNLGQWKAQDGVKLNYAGDSFWQAECVMTKDDFPLKYPFGP
nr:4-alpha-glucanotransferase DPE2-like [Ipomoea batatas]GMD46478.1 4-alpha-glucanotransferase DPE2-like [Ipomoea batatas]